VWWADVVGLSYGPAAQYVVTRRSSRYSTRAWAAAGAHTPPTAKPSATAGSGLATLPIESPALELEPWTVEVPDLVQQRYDLNIAFFIIVNLVVNENITSSFCVDLKNYLYKFVLGA
jgi:hypothetical protein